MKPNSLLDSLELFEALSAESRLQIITLLAEKPRNIAELAAALEISSAAVPAHVRKLESAKIVGSVSAPGKHGAQKICKLLVNEVTVPLANNARIGSEYNVTMPVGHYVNWSVKPTCGLLSPTGIIGHFDDPRYFADPRHINAGMLWFTSGYVEYRFPNYLLSSQKPVALEFTFELCSEAPGYNNEWPSDIHFHVNGLFAGMWTSPGDFGGRRGIHNPTWMPNGWSQYGLLKVLRIDMESASIDGLMSSKVNLNDLSLDSRSDITLRLEVPETAEHVGGISLFGQGFGNYGQPISMRLMYDKKDVAPGESPADVVPSVMPVTIPNTVPQSDPLAQVV
jgi:predicted transcriptional regulator